MPSEISAVSPGFGRVIRIAVLLMLLAGGLVFFLSGAPLSVPDFFSLPNLAMDIQPKPTGTISVPTVEMLFSPTHTAAPTTFTPVPTDDLPVQSSVTPVLLASSYTYEVTKLPSGASYGLLIHIVTQGETLDQIAGNYSTTVQAIMAVNYDLTPPIWADYPIVIPVGAKDVKSPPSFKVYVVKDYETISAEALANILAVDVKDLKFYNLCGMNCQFIKGDVLLVPHNL